jgi:hypothetical protein
MCFLTPPIGLRWSFARCLSSLHPAAHASPLPSAGGHLCCLLISFPPAPHLSGPLPHLMPPVPVLRAACWHPPLQERLVAMDTSSGSNSHGHKHRRRDRLVSCAPFREEAGRFGKRIDGASIFFLQSLHVFLCSRGMKIQMTSICRLHSCTELSACTRYVANMITSQT